MSAAQGLLVYFDTLGVTIPYFSLSPPKSKKAIQLQINFGSFLLSVISSPFLELKLGWIRLGIVQVKLYVRAR